MSLALAGFAGVGFAAAPETAAKLRDKAVAACVKNVKLDRKTRAGAPVDSGSAITVRIDGVEPNPRIKDLEASASCRFDKRTGKTTIKYPPD